jgi:hypothetical protein
MIPYSTLAESARRPLTRSLALATSPHWGEVKETAPTSPLPNGERSEAIADRFRVRGTVANTLSVMDTIVRDVGLREADREASR